MSMLTAITVPDLKMVSTDKMLISTDTTELDLKMDLIEMDLT